MPPNAYDVSEPIPTHLAERPKNTGPTEAVDSVSPVLKVVRSVTNLIAHILIGITTGVSLVFAFRSQALPLNATNLHIVLCVIGFQFLMSEAILCLAPDSWLSSLGLKHKRWVHWVLQILGSVLALTGCFIKIVDKEQHWTTLHGRFALVAMVFTSVSLVNGLASMYAYELRRFIPGILSKLTHICFGIVSIVSAGFALAYGFDKGFFRTWAWSPMADILIVMTAAFTTIVVINPFITFYSRCVGQFKK